MTTSHDSDSPEDTLPIDVQTVVDRYEKLSTKNCLSRAELAEMVKILKIAQKNSVLRSFIDRIDRKTYEILRFLKPEIVETLKRQHVQVVALFEEKVRNGQNLISGHNIPVVEGSEASAQSADGRVSSDDQVEETNAVNQTMHRNDPIPDIQGNLQDDIQKVELDQESYFHLSKDSFIDRIESQDLVNFIKVMIDIYSPGEEYQRLMWEYAYLSSISTTRNPDFELYLDRWLSRLEDILKRATTDIWISFFTSKIDRYILKMNGLLSQVNVDFYEDQKAKIQEFITTHPDAPDQEDSKTLSHQLQQLIADSLESDITAVTMQADDKTQVVSQMVPQMAPQMMPQMVLAAAAPDLNLERLNVERLNVERSLQKRHSLGRFLKKSRIVMARYPLCPLLVAICGSLVLAATVGNVFSSNVNDQNISRLVSNHVESSFHPATPVASLQSFSQSMSKFLTRLNLEPEAQQSVQLQQRFIRVLEESQLAMEKYQQSSEADQSSAEAEQLMAESYQKLAETQQLLAEANQIAAETNQRQIEARQWLHEARTWEQLASKWKARSAIELQEAQRHLTKASQSRQTARMIINRFPVVSSSVNIPGVISTPAVTSTPGISLSTDYFSGPNH